jgi:hypothetical protein
MTARGRRVIVRLIGGFGNQLFQLAHAYARLAATPHVLLDTSWYTSIPSSDTPRQLELRLESTGLPSVSLPSFLWSPRIGLAHGETDGEAGWLRNRLDSRMRLETGYWQSWDQVSRVQERMQNFLRSMCQENGLEIRPRQGYVAVHVRLGDYLNPAAAEYHGVTDAIHQLHLAQDLSRRLGLGQIRIFTDSPEELRRRAPATEVGEIDKSRDALSAMVGMAGANALVMSNSSLSWWAAVFGGGLASRDMPVYMPTPWFRQPSAHDSDLLAPGWVPYRRHLDKGTSA